MIGCRTPNRRVEAWKYSDLRAALGDAPLPADGARPEHAWNRLDGIIDRLALGQDHHHAITKVRAGESELLVERLDMQALSASVREIQVLPGASLTRVVIQSSAANSVVLNAAHISLSEGARFRQFILAEGAILARVEELMSSSKEKALRSNSTAFIFAMRAATDLTSVIEHKAGGARPGSWSTAWR